MSRIRQDIQVALSQPTSNWFGDAWLTPPVLIGPKDKSVLCSPEAEFLYFISNGNVGVTLSWAAVAGAAYYVVQWSVNESFAGPAVRSARVSAAQTSYALRFLSDIALGEEVYWRVMAFATGGAVSATSDTWSFIYECPNAGGNTENREPGCSGNNIDIKIFGKKVVGGYEQNMYHAQIGYDCKLANGNTLSISDITWSIRQSSANNISIVCQDSGVVVIQTDADTSEMFEVEVTVTFEEDDSAGTTFACTASYPVTLDAHSQFEPNIRHAKISCDYGCNIYGIDFVDRTFDDPSLASSSSGGSGESCYKPMHNLCDCFPPCSSNSSSSSSAHPTYCFDWLESATSRGEGYAADIVSRNLPNGRLTLPVGTDIIVARIGVLTPPDSSSSNSAVACTPAGLAQRARWWIIEVDETNVNPCDRPTLQPVTDVRCVIDCDGTQHISVCTTRVIYPPGTVICPECCPPPSECPT